jgi:fibronectin type 3 domain-containing protein
VHLGSLANTYGAAAFTANGPHDMNFQSNQVSQSDPHGVEFRLLLINTSSSFNDIVSNNTFTGGQVGNELTYLTSSGTYKGINDPEIIMAEGYSVDYEGPVGAVSGDGWVLILPPVSSAVSFRGVFNSTLGPGLIASIVNTHKSDGSANTLAGQWFPIAQQISASPPTFLMRMPMPTGHYVISVTSGFVYDQYSGNTINIAGKSSAGFHLPGNQFGTQVVGNTIVGGGTYVYDYTGTGILVEAAGSNPNPDPSGSSVYPYPMPTYWTHAPNLGVVVSGNTIENSPNGIQLDATHGSSEKTSTGRVYLTGTVQNNVIEWTQDWLTSWDTQFHQIKNGSNYLANAPNPGGDNSRPPSITVGYGFDANGGLRVPSTVGGAQGYVDPGEMALTIQSNSADVLSSSGPPALQAEPTGQVYDGVVNGVVSPTSSYPYNQPNYHVAGDPTNYAPYNANNLNITGNQTSVSPYFPYTYDFGPQNQVVATGDIGVNNFSIYSAAQGYGWTTLSSNTNAFDLGAIQGSNAMTRDYVYGTLLTFQVDLPNGSYEVSPTLGDQGNFAHIAQIYVQGTQVDTISTTAGQVVTQNYAATVADGHLTLGLVGVGSDQLALIEGMRILSLQFDIGTTDQVVASGYTPVSNYTDYSAAQGYGWSAASSNANSFNYGAVSGSTAVTRDGFYASDFTFQVDLPNGSYNVTPTLGDVGPFAHTAQVYVQGALVATVTTSAGQVVTPTYVATVSNGHLALELIGVGSDQFAVIEGLAVALKTQNPIQLQLQAVGSNARDAKIASSGINAIRINGGDGYAGGTTVPNAGISITPLDLFSRGAVPGFPGAVSTGHVRSIAAARPTRSLPTTAGRSAFGALLRSRRPEQIGSTEKWSSSLSQ